MILQLNHEMDFVFYMEVGVMAGNLRIGSYLAFYNSGNYKTGAGEVNYGNSSASGCFASSNGSKMQSDVAFSVSENINNANRQSKQEELNNIRNQLRQMKREQIQKSDLFTSTSNSIDDFLKMSGSPDAEEDTEKHVSKYNYKDVANKIIRAKNSQSAGQAVLSAKRKVAEVKRMIGRGDGDPQELQLALTHAKRMEMVARKKKHHLELEEYVQRTQMRDEQQEKEEVDTQSISSMMTENAENEISDKEDAIFEARQDMISEVMESFEENATNVSDDALASINDMISEFGEEELEMLEESMRMLEDMEIVDPHMSKEDLEELKQRHRNSENKAITKANMEYLKGMFKHLEESKGYGKSNSLTLGSGMCTAGTSYSTFSSAAGAVQGVVAGSGSVDIQI